MRFRTYKNTKLTVSEVGFGLWTISTGWWGNFTEGEGTGRNVNDRVGERPKGIGNHSQMIN